MTKINRKDCLETLKKCIHKLLSFFKSKMTLTISCSKGWFEIVANVGLNIPVLETEWIA